MNNTETNELVIPSDPEMTATFPVWLAACQKLIDEYYAKNLDRLTPPRLRARLGKRFIAINSHDVHNGVEQPKGSAYAFIDTTGGLIDKTQHQRGDILKPASWSKPAKHARGNLFDADIGMKQMGVYGPNYLR